MKFRNIICAFIISIAAFAPAAAQQKIPAGVQVLAAGKSYNVDKAPGHLVVIDFNATWCGPCRRFEPIFKAAAQKYKGEVEFLSVDIDKHQHMVQNLGIRSVPTLLFIQPDGKLNTWVGFLPQDKFFEAIDQLK